MNSQAGATSAEELQGRIADLEQQLASAASVAKTHEAKEASLRETLEYTENIVDTVREPLLVLDAALRVTHASRSFYETFAVRPKATLGRFLYELGNGEWDVPGLRKLLEEVLPRDQKVNDFEVKHEFLTLGRRVMLLNARKLWRENNPTERVLLAIEDVTERRRVESELLQSNEDLQRFADVAAHDLRSPLNAALRTTQLVARHLKGKIGDDDFWMLSESIRSMERLAKLMEDILTYSEAGNEPQQLTPVGLQEPLDAAVANLKHHIRDCGAVLSIQDLPQVLGDKTQMMMVFQNLLNNALKYRRDEPLRIGIDAVAVGKCWRVAVSDNGQGFETEYAESIFLPFKRLHGPSIPGSGLGLATCKRIIERFGGKLWAESSPGKGSTFYFSLPGEDAGE